FEQVQELVRTKAFVSADPGTRRSMLESFITSSAPIDLQQQFQQAKDAGPAQAIGLLNSLIVEAAKPTSGEQTQQTIEEYAPMAGAVAGGIIAAPTIVGQTVGVTAGTMFGRMIPELTRQHLTGKPGQLGEALRLGIQHDLIEVPPLVAGSEIVFRGGGKLLGAATRGLSKEAAPEINAARSVLERKIPIKDAHGKTIREVDSMTGGLTLGQQAKEGGLLQTAEAVVRGSFGGKRPFRKLEAENEKNLDSFVDEIVSRYAPDKSSSELGSALEEAVYGKNGSYQTARKISHDMHQEIDRLTANASVATSEAADFIRANEKIPAMRELYKAISVEAAHGGGKAYGGKRGLEALLGMTQDGTNGLTSFANADIAQSAVGAALRELERKGELGSANLARALFAKIRTDMDQSMARLNDPNIADLYHYAKHFHSEEVFGRFQNKLILGLANELRERPGALSAKLLAPGNVDLLKAVKDAAPPAMFNDIRKSLIFTM
ncbi:MAG: hypothetical protein KDB07_10105, partial [Planctomycetes bacterium]|nr:hypothetical protein [Planctomycetota bacterium]